MEHIFFCFCFFHTDFTACLHGVSPLLIKLKAHLFNPPTRTILRQNMRNYRIGLSLWCKFVSVREDQTEWTCFLVFFVHFLSQVHTEFGAIYSPFDSTFNTCFLAILSSSAPLLSSHSRSPRLPLSYWSAANGIKRYLSIARLLGSINTGTSLN